MVLDEITVDLLGLVKVAELNVTLRNEVLLLGDRIGSGIGLDRSFELRDCVLQVNATRIPDPAL